LLEYTVSTNQQTTAARGEIIETQDDHDVIHEHEVAFALARNESSIGAMVTHLLLSKNILPAGPILTAAQWVLAIVSVLSAIVAIIDDMRGDVGASTGGVTLFVVFTAFGMVAFVLAAVGIDKLRESWGRKRGVSDGGLAAASDHQEN
jgi:glucose-6-phosphate isomerase